MQTDVDRQADAADGCRLSFERIHSSDHSHENAKYKMQQSSDAEEFVEIVPGRPGKRIMSMSHN